MGRLESRRYLVRVRTDEIEVRLTNPIFPIERIVSKLKEGIILSRLAEEQRAKLFANYG